MSLNKPQLKFYKVPQIGNSHSSVLSCPSTLTSHQRGNNPSDHRQRVRLNDFQWTFLSFLSEYKSGSDRGLDDFEMIFWDLTFVSDNDIPTQLFNLPLTVLQSQTRTEFDIEITLWSKTFLLQSCYFYRSLCITLPHILLLYVHIYQDFFLPHNYTC